MKLCCPFDYLRICNNSWALNNFVVKLEMVKKKKWIKWLKYKMSVPYIQPVDITSILCEYNKIDSDIVKSLESVSFLLTLG